jgi:ParB/RepB/Spo0J family partition protein
MAGGKPIASKSADSVSTEKISVRRLEDIPLKQIEVGEGNVRQHQQMAGIEELKVSIQKYGLIHPVILIQRGDKKYELIVGQRRYYAFEALGRETIPAIIINPLTPITQKIVSFGENIHRKQLPYEDTIAVCEELYKRDTGGKFERVEKIAKELGISTGTVTKYLSYKLVPKEVQRLVTDNKLSADLAYKVTTSFWPNEQKIVKIANYVTRMTKPEWSRALDVGRKKPDASVDEIVQEAKKPPTTYEIVIPVDIETRDILNKIASKRNTDLVGLVKNLIDELIQEAALA